MANLIYISESEIINAPNVNLLPEFAMFNDVFTWNVVSGTATASNINQQQLEGERCLRIVPTTACLVNSGGSQMSFTVLEDGNHIFSIRNRCAFSTTNTQEVRIKVYINAVATDYVFFADSDNNAEYRTYFSTIPNLITDDVIDFAFQFQTPSGGGNIKHYFDAFKFEYDAYGLGLPTIFSQPLPIVIEDSVVVDVPSISSNSYYEVTTTLTGAEIGDYVQITYPTEIITLGLIVGYPIVTATDTVSFLIHNHSGGALNPASGTYTFKIVK